MICVVLRALKGIGRVDENVSNIAGAIMFVFAICLLTCFVFASALYCFLFGPVVVVVSVFFSLFKAFLTSIKQNTQECVCLCRFILLPFYMPLFSGRREVVLLFIDFLEGGWGWIGKEWDGMECN